MKKRILIEASGLSDLEKMQLFDQGQRRENIRACKVDKLINYYKITLAHDLHRARAQIEGELNHRDLDEFIAPMQVLKKPMASIFTDEVARSVIDAKGDSSLILNKAYKSFSHASVIITAYVLAIIAEELELESELRRFIKEIGTYVDYMNEYMQSCSTDPQIVDRLTELAKDMKEYKAWA